MASLGKALRKTIRNLEQLRDSQDHPSDTLLDLLDELYGLQIRLVDAAINKNTKKYKKATAALQEAAKRTRKATEDLAKLDKALKKVAQAIARITELLAAIA